MGISIGDKRDAEKWLTEEGWLVFSYSGDGFASYLEDKYFTPGTKKNADFEVLVAPLNTPDGAGISFWYRIKDTKANRRALKKATEEYYQCELSWEIFEESLTRIRRKIGELVKFLR